MYFWHLGFLTTRACPENSFPWNFLLYGIYFLLFRIFKQLALALKHRVALEFFTVLKYFLSFRIFEQLPLALKNRVCPGFSHCMEHTFYIQNFEQVALAPKNRVALELSLYWICIFLSFRIFEQLALALKNRVTLKFFTVWNILFTFRSFELFALALKSRGCPKFTVFNIFFYSDVLKMYFLFSGVSSNLRLPWKFSSPGQRPPPRPPASYAYGDHLRLAKNTFVKPQSLLYRIRG